MELLETGEKTVPGSLQSEVSWFLKQLDHILEPGDPGHQALKVRLEALLKPTPAGGVRNSSLVRCPDLAN